MSSSSKKTVIKTRLEYWQNIYTKLQEAYIAMIEGKVKSYTIDDRSLTYHSLSELMDAMEEAEDKIDELEAALAGNKPRRAVGVLPRDW